MQCYHHNNYQIQQVKLETNGRKTTTGIALVDAVNGLIKAKAILKNKGAVPKTNVAQSGTLNRTGRSSSRAYGAALRMFS